MVSSHLPAIVVWYRKHAREICWRTPHTSAWGILLSEVMSQQTQVRRVEPLWREWMKRWPTPQAFAAARPAEILQAWGNLGYPRRALRLHACAKTIVERHHGEVPSAVPELLALPGIGDYTARAVAAFAFGQRVAVVDTNVRRVIARLYHGNYHAPNPSRRELEFVESLLPTTGAPEASVALMELGAVVCTSQQPRCSDCPVQAKCAWYQAGAVVPPARPPRQRRFAGSDRQVRGKIMAELRSHQAVQPGDLEVLWPDKVQLEKAINSLLIDGLAEKNSAGLLTLPQ